MRHKVGEIFRNSLTKNLDTASSYEHGLEQMRIKFYDLVVVDGLNGNCFQFVEDTKEIRHGQIVIFSFSEELAIAARKKKIPFYRKPEDLGKLISDYR